MKRIQIIGGGQIGSRHLQALARLPFPAAIEVMDPDPAALETCRERLNQMAPLAPAGGAVFVTRYDELSPEADLALVTTNSYVRAQAVRSLLGRVRVPLLVLEKVVFQTVADFEEIDRLLEASGTQAFVNCPFRLYRAYGRVRELIPDFSGARVEIIGGDWEMGSSLIHFLDLLAWWARDTRMSLCIEGLDRDVYPSKRPGFHQFSGSIRAEFPGGLMARITSEKAFTHEEKPVRITIDGPDFRAVLDVGERTCLVETGPGLSHREEFPLDMPYQSELTHMVAQGLFETGACGLTPYRESMAIHIPMLEVLTGHLRACLDPNLNRCSIT